MPLSYNVWLPWALTYGLQCVLSYCQHFTEDAIFFITADCGGLQQYIFCAMFMEQEFVEAHMWYYMLEKVHKNWNIFVNIWIQICVSYLLLISLWLDPFRLRNTHPYRKACRSRGIKVAAPLLDSPCDRPVTYPGDSKTLVKSLKGRSRPTLNMTTQLGFTDKDLGNWK